MGMEEGQPPRNDLSWGRTRMLRTFSGSPAHPAPDPMCAGASPLGATIIIAREFMFGALRRQFFQPPFERGVRGRRHLSKQRVAQRGHRVPVPLAERQPER